MRLRLLRDEHNLTQEKMAELIGKKKGNVSNYESDSYEPSAQTIAAICRTFNVSADWLLFGEMYVPKSEQTNYSAEDVEFLAKYHQLSEKDRNIIEGRIEMLLELAGNQSDSSSKQSKSQTSTNGDGREEAATEEQGA